MTFRRFVKLFIPQKIFKKIETYGHLGEAVVFNVLYRFPARRMNVIGVTGTSGKTSTCFLVHRMLHEAGYKVGLMTTVAYGAGSDIKPNNYHMTSVPTPELMRCIKDFRNKKIDWLVLETSSQALAQNRVWGIPYSIAVMTNVTHEHLDYHRTFERYREAKRKLFRWCDRNQHGLRVGVINADDPSAKLFAASIKRPITYGIERGDMKATKIALQPDGISYQVEHDKKIIYSIKCQLPGKFNVYNSLVAASIGNVLGLNRNQVEKGIAALESVEGRMTRVDEGQDFTVLVDFAHTPDSFEKLLSDMRPIVKGKMIVLFGSPGRRDEAKRAIQGEISGRYADVIVATEDDERDADGQEIMRQIAEGAELAGKVIGKDVFMVHNRTEAIQYAINLAHKGDAVLLLGKGHEKTIARADGDHPWNEVGAARTAIKNRLKEK